MTDTVKQLAPSILDIIKGSSHVLLHCHPSPDPDSVGSALAMKLALESLGKKVTLIAGDSIVPEAFSHFPSFETIVVKNFFEIDLTLFDLFIIQDSGSLEMISRKGPIVFPASMKTVVIDHHVSNTKYAREVNLVDSTYPATAQLLFDLFTLWNIHISPEIATNLFVGMFTDTGGFKYAGTTHDTFATAAALSEICPDFHTYIFEMENANRPGMLAFEGFALSHIETFPVGVSSAAASSGPFIAIAAISKADIDRLGLTAEDVSAHRISNQLKSVVGWDVGVGLTELISGEVKASFRTRDATRYDLSKIAPSLGGGGHKAAAGATLLCSIDEAKKKIVDAVRAHTARNTK